MVGCPFEWFIGLSSFELGFVQSISCFLLVRSGVCFRLFDFGLLLQIGFFELRVVLLEFKHGGS